MASHVKEVEDYMRPPILRLPVELQLHIFTFLSIRCKKCCLPRADSHRRCVARERAPAAVGRGRASAILGRLTHRYSASSCYRITITNPTILSLRCTNVHFSMLIPLTQKLLLEVERWLRFRRSKALACCVCLRLRVRDKFAIHATAGVQDIDKEEDFVSRRRFCVDCGFFAYPHPHPVLLPRRQQQRLGVEPLGLTTYAPGTKIKFFRTWSIRPETFDVWVWCLDCRLLKIRAEAGSLQCKFFCKECCKRLGCEDLRAGNVEHVGYEGIKGEIETETRRKHTRLEAGRIYMARGNSLLLRNKKQGGDLEQGQEQGQEEEDNDGQITTEWRHWFENQGTPTILPKSLISTQQHPDPTMP